LTDFWDLRLLELFADSEYICNVIYILRRGRGRKDNEKKRVGHKKKGGERKDKQEEWGKKR
jgi:hypothetical protein